MNKPLTDARAKALAAAVEADAQRGPIAFVAVVSNEIPGHFGLGTGVANERGYLPVPAVWAIFETMDAAEANADTANAALGHSDRDVFGIIASTMGGIRFCKKAKGAA